MNHLLPIIRRKRRPLVPVLAVMPGEKTDGTKATEATTVTVAKEQHNDEPAPTQDADDDRA
jgi:hypothetical protein